MGIADQGDLPMCAPHTASYFRIEREIEINGIFADIRHFGWNEGSRALYEPNSYYLDFSLGPRCPNSRFFRTANELADPPGDVVFLPKGGEFATWSEPGEHSLLCLTFANERAEELFEDERIADLAPCLDVQSVSIRQGLVRLANELRHPGFGQAILLESMALLLSSKQPPFPEIGISTGCRIRTNADLAIAAGETGSKRTWAPTSRYPASPPKFAPVRDISSAPFARPRERR